jgi:hypothetical protein
LLRPSNKLLIVARIALEIDDKERTDNALRGIGGKRLTYRTVD